VQSGGSFTDSFFQADWLGSTRYVTDSTGQQTLAAQNYDAWGNRVAGTGLWHPTDLQWAGAWGYQREYSNGPAEPGLGLYYVQQRYYEPSTGRWFAQDPLGIAVGTNLYAYTADPVGSVDPTGLVTKREIDKVVKTAKQNGWEEVLEPGTSHPRKLVKDGQRIPLPNPHAGDKDRGLLGDIRKQVQRNFCPSTDLRTLVDQTIGDETVILPEALLALPMTTFPAEPWWESFLEQLKDAYRIPPDGIIPGLPPFPVPQALPIPAWIPLRLPTVPEIRIPVFAH
jgi:RHS repeat-associated protein